MHEKHIEGDCKSRLTSFCVNAPHFEYACLQQTANHLGSSSFITNTIGYATQHLQYLPFGETFVDQQNGYDSRYTFSAKEKDDETQYSYFGARYYDADLSVWLSVDPLSDKYPNLSPYAYCANNPVKIIDPNGMDIVVTSTIDGETESYSYKPGESYMGKNEFISKTVDNLNKIHATDKGKGEIEKLDGDDFLLTIVEADGVGSNTYLRKDYSGFKNVGVLKAEDDGWIFRSGVKMDALEGLAHEIQHAYDDAIGTKYSESTWELNAVNFQNYITSVYDRGGMRTKYSGLFSGLSSDEKTYNPRLEKITNYQLNPTYVIPPQVIVTGGQNSTLRHVQNIPGILKSLTPSYTKTYGR